MEGLREAGPGDLIVHLKKGEVLARDQLINCLIPRGEDVRIDSRIDR